MIHGDDLWSTLVVVREKLIDQVDQQLELKKRKCNTDFLEHLYSNTANLTH